MSQSTDAIQRITISHQTSTQLPIVCLKFRVDVPLPGLSVRTSGVEPAFVTVSDYARFVTESSDCQRVDCNYSGRSGRDIRQLRFRVFVLLVVIRRIVLVIGMQEPS